MPGISMPDTWLKASINQGIMMPDTWLKASFNQGIVMPATNDARHTQVGSHLRELHHILVTTGVEHVPQAVANGCQPRRRVAGA